MIGNGWAHDHGHRQRSRIDGSDLLPGAPGIGLKFGVGWPESPTGPEGRSFDQGHPLRFAEATSIKAIEIDTGGDWMTSIILAIP
jgi:hypothetical protein